MEKLNMTRPQFLLKFFNGEVSAEDMKILMPDHYSKVYCCYSLIKGSNFKRQSVIAANLDQEDGSISIQFNDSAKPKALKEVFNKTIVSVGNYVYRAKIKARGSFAVIILESSRDEEAEDSE